MPRPTSPSDSDRSGQEVPDEQPTKNPDADGEEEVDDNEEEEYEIETIIDAKRGVFPDGRIGYLVKWKGYPSSENSYVDEKDIGGAGDLVREFWSRHPKKNLGSQHSTSARKKGRQSTAEAASTAGTKRGRKSTAKVESEDEDDQSASAVRASKKAKRGTNNNNAKSASTLGRSVSPEISAKAETMPDNYADIEDWNPVVKSIDTVELDANDHQLYVYFTLHDGTQVKELTSLAKERFAHKLIDFYEAHLRWRAAEAE